ncbi:Threonine dehydratase biosynthetic, chloroplastic [Rhizophlyctis rosea]|uniref:Threonine dehydratase n=1 Tax=Rhizophlyctis rosea TaxID=64517 RepID=A0AAD5SJ93_9FUNG|nr:Threonine dehydratase biosynthetic, chloroplastic [Rhizophlyctis rosea]
MSSPLLAVAGGQAEDASVIHSPAGKRPRSNDTLQNGERKRRNQDLDARHLAQTPPPNFDTDDLLPPSWYPNPHHGTPNNTPTAAANNIIPDYLRLILTASVYDVAIESPLQEAHNLSARLHNTILLKREDMQPVFSFKLRGAYNRMQQLTPTERTKGVIACSAGNHAQGVALSAQKMGIKATIVMPIMTPPIKWRNVKRLGAEVVLFGSDFDEAKAECARLEKEHGYINIPPYDDPYVIAGQGTVAVETLRQHSGKIDAIFVCVGGGGLAAGVASYVKRLHPHIKVIGVETHDADAMTQSLKTGTRVVLPTVGLFADGAAVRNVGEESFRVCKELLDGMILVSTDEICAAIKDAFEDTRSIVEPAGALGIAGAKKYAQVFGTRGETYVAVTSGANMNFDRLRFVAERAELGESKEALITAVIPEKPGSFMDLYKTIYPRSVSEFAYRYSDPEEAHIFMSFMVTDRAEELKKVIAACSAKGFTVRDASGNELAKSHARYLVGGKGKVKDERLFRFEFPERPGALNHFLTSLKNPKWNVSLFHYRNYGGDVSKVLVGVQVPEETGEEFDRFLNELNFPFVEETANQVYTQFLR